MLNDITLRIIVPIMYVKMGRQIKNYNSKKKYIHFIKIRET
jgi:hypothetical protein